MGDRIKEIFEEAGLPPAVLQVIHSGSTKTLKELMKIPDINLVTFTGSTQGGRLISEATASRFVPVSLELGGNDPAYVRPDVDIPFVAEQLLDGAVFNAGQCCCAVERVYVHTDIHDAFVAEVQKALAQSVFSGPQTSCEFLTLTKVPDINLEIPAVRQSTSAQQSHARLRSRLTPRSKMR